MTSTTQQRKQGASRIVRVSSTGRTYWYPLQMSKIHPYGRVA